MSEWQTGSILMTHDVGLHARPSVKLTKLAKGYASDIELMFIYDSNGQTAGPRQLTTSEFYERLVQEVRKAIRTRREGSFDLDLQLRPYGSAGSLAVFA